MKHGAAWMVCLLGWAVTAGGAPARGGLWTHEVTFEAPPKAGVPQTGKASLWIPEGAGKVRGLFYPGGIIIGPKLAKDSVFRAALAEKGMGVVFFDPNFGSSFIRGAGERFEKAMAELAKASGHPEVEFAPVMTAGHSADGLFCRNVAYWKPHRVIGVLMLKSGNFHHAIEDMSRSLAGTPLALISGEFEEFGPEGGDPNLGVGLRAEYSLHPTDKKKQNQTQWVMARMQMLGRRQKNPDNLWSLIVHRGKGHTSWDDEMRDLCCLIARSWADARIPADEPDGKTEVRCKPLTAREGWLYDADIKTPKHKAAPCDRYDGNKNHAFWAADKTLAEAICAYHDKGWPVPDPTAGQPDEKRFTVPAELADLVDAPPPKPFAWKTGDGTWTADQPDWRDSARPVAWDVSRQAVFEGKPGVVTVGTNVVCQGLKLGNGYTLNLGQNSLRARWHAELAADSTVVIRVVVDPATGKGRAGKLRLDGNATLAGMLRVELEGTLPKGGKFTVLSIGGLRKGDSGKVELPEGWTWEQDRWGWNAVAPKPGAPAKKTGNP